MLTIWYQSDPRIPRRQPYKRRKNRLKKRTKSRSHFHIMMASTSSIDYEIRKFDGKNFALWKEIMQDLLIIRCQVEEIQHNTKPASMTTEEWCSLDEIARSTIRMHLAENIYFSMPKRHRHTPYGRSSKPVWKEIIFIETHIDPTIVQYEDEGVGAVKLSHQHLYPGVGWTLLSRAKL